jgi:hypothetical protein
MMEAVRTSETSVDNNFTRQYIPEHNSELADDRHFKRITASIITVNTVFMFICSLFNDTFSVTDTI